MLVNQIAGTRMKPVTGYQGQNEINIAAERGEVQGNNTGLSNLTVNRADWMRDGKVRILIQYGTERLPAIKDVPTAMELAPSDADRAVLRTYAAKFAWRARSPSSPTQRIASPRCRRHSPPPCRMRNISATPKRSASTPTGSAGRELTDMVRQVDATPQAVVDRLRELLARAGEITGRNRRTAHGGGRITRHRRHRPSDAAHRRLRGPVADSAARHPAHSAGARRAAAAPSTNSRRRSPPTRRRSRSSRGWAST